MVKQGTSTVVPRLRFPEFREANAWKTDKVGAKTASFSGGTPDTSVKEFYGGDIPFIRSAEIGAKSTELSLSEAGLGSSAAKLVTRGDVLVALYGANSGDVAVAKIDGAINQAILCLRSVDNNFFLHQYLSAKKDWIIATYLQGGQGNLSGDIVKSIALGFPSASEQKKIADCLTSLDKVIAAQGRKVEALKAHKRGLMQQLFPREGETRPRLRFPEFRDAPEWSATLLGDLTLIVRGGSPRPIDAFLTHVKDGLNWLKIGDVDREAKYVTKTEEKVRPEALAKTRVIHAGDFILSNSMSFGRPYISAIETCIHDGWIAVTEIPEGLSREFLYYSILSDKSQRYFANQAAGSGVQNLNKDIIKLLQLEIPTKEEQQRIAECLSSLDTQITADTNQLAALKIHKQGLMQQLFPAPDAASA